MHHHDHDHCDFNDGGYLVAILFALGPVLVAGSRPPRPSKPLPESLSLPEVVPSTFGGRCKAFVFGQIVDVPIAVALVLWLLPAAGVCALIGYLTL